MIDRDTSVIYNGNIMTGNKTLYSVPEVAQILGVTRQEVVRRIWRGFIKAEMVGKQYVITKKEVARIKKKA